MISKGQPKTLESACLHHGIENLYSVVQVLTLKTVLNLLAVTRTPWSYNCIVTLTDPMFTLGAFLNTHQYINHYCTLMQVGTMQFSEVHCTCHI